RIAAKGRTWSWKIARAFGLRFLFAPIRFLILIGFALSLLATFVSAFGIHEKVCIEDHQEHLNPVFCPYTQGKHGVQEILKVIAPIRQGEQGGAAQSKHDRSGS
ncbi:MAG: hypothetical protein KGL56_09420, partial [Alphaproteobacteria bacterium]|nr:hypothetical protein [Alphaproteobacteria bacterium]